MSDIITFVPVNKCLFLVIQEKLIKGKLKAKPLALEGREKKTKDTSSLRIYMIQ